MCNYTAHVCVCMCQPTPFYSVHALSLVSPSTLLALSLLNFLSHLVPLSHQSRTEIQNQNSVHGRRNYFLRGVTVSFNGQISPVSWWGGLRQPGFQKERSDAATDMGQTKFNEH